MAVPMKADSSRATKWRIRPLRSANVKRNGKFAISYCGVPYGGYLWPSIADAMAAIAAAESRKDELIEDVERKP